VNPFENYVQMRNCDRVTAVNVNFKLAPAAILDFVGSKIWQ